MEKFLVNEEQRKDILLMHKALLNNKKSKTIKEQTAQPNPIATDEDVLRKAAQAGCLRNGKLRTNNAKTKVIYRAKTKTGKIVDFYPNMTYKLQDGSKSGSWKCPQVQTLITQDQENQSKVETLKKQNWKTLDELKKEGVDLNTLDKSYEKTSVGSVVLYRPIGGKTVHHANTSTSEFNKEQQSFIDRFVDIGYVLNPSRIDQQTMVAYTDKDLGAPADLFPNGLTLWYDPQKQKFIDNDKSILSDIIGNQSIDRKSCKKNVEDYYKVYTQRKSFKVDPALLGRAKRVVQACKDQYYGEWPALTGGKTLDKYLDVLSGNVAGGPSGEFEYFRLK
jgi:hypothetical protein